MKKLVVTFPRFGSQMGAAADIKGLLENKRITLPGLAVLSEVMRYHATIIFGK